jgi:hypothetical protein
MGTDDPWIQRLGNVRSTSVLIVTQDSHLGNKHPQLSFMNSVNLISSNEHICFALFQRLFVIISAEPDVQQDYPISALRTGNRWMSWWPSHQHDLRMDWGKYARPCSFTGLDCPVYVLYTAPLITW